MTSTTRANVKRLKLICVVVDRIIELESLISEMFDSKAFVILWIFSRNLARSWVSLMKKFVEFGSSRKCLAVWSPLYCKGRSDSMSSFGANRRRPLDSSQFRGTTNRPDARTCSVRPESGHMIVTSLSSKKNTTHEKEDR